MSKSFSETGYIILKNAIRKSLIKEIQYEVYDCLKIKEINQKKKYLKFCKNVKNLKKKEFDFTKPIFELLHYKKLLEKMFLEKKFYKTLTGLLGKDLAYCTDPGANLNLPNKSDVKKIIFLKIGIKKFGQVQALQRFRYGHL